MIFEKEKVVSYNNENYLLMSILERDNAKYAFANRMNFMSDTSSDEYSILCMKDGVISLVIDDGLMSELLPIFQKQIAEDVKKEFGDDLSSLYSEVE